MRTPSIVCLSLTAVTTAGILVACDDPSSANPNRPSAPAITAVQLLGPDTLAPGQSAQYTVVARAADGTQKTAGPGTLNWNADNSFIRVDASGVATAQQRTGDTTLRVRVLNSAIVGAKEITIVPEGTFRVVGRIFDAEFDSAPVPAARVAVSPGALVTTTDANGQYRLYGVPADATLQITREGYSNLEHRLQLNGHVTQDFRMTPLGGRLSLNGDYTLEIDTGNVCPGSFTLASELRSRRYDAVVTQNGIIVDVQLTEPRFKPSSGRGNRFSGQIAGSTATFTLESFELGYYYVYSYPSVAEQLPDGSVFVPAGTVITTGTSGRVLGLMSSNSSVSHWSSRFPNFPNFLGWCGSQAPITFALTAR